MSASRHRADDYDDALAFGELPETNRWDRDRFDRMREEMDRLRRPPHGAPVMDDRPRGRGHDRPRYEDDSNPQRVASRVRREVLEETVRNDRALRHEPRDEFDWVRNDEIIIEHERAERPAPLMRRSSSMNSLLHRPHEDYVPRQHRRESPAAQGRVVREELREEIIRDTQPARFEKRSPAYGISRSVNSHHSRHQPSESSVSSRGSFADRSASPGLPGKKGYSRLPKGRFTRDAIERLEVPYSNDGEFWKVHRALSGPLLNDLLRWSNESNEAARANAARRAYAHEEDGESDSGHAQREHYEKISREWINPRSSRESASLRAPSPPRRSRAPSVPSPMREDINININNQPPRPAPIIQPIYAAQPLNQPVVQPPFSAQWPNPARWVPPQQAQPMEISVMQRTERSHADIEDEIRRLEAERIGLRAERSGVTMARPSNVVYTSPAYQPGQMQLVPVAQPGVIVPYRPRSKSMPRPKSPKGEVYRVAKDKKGRLALVRSKN